MWEPIEMEPFIGPVQSNSININPSPYLENKSLTLSIREVY